MRSIPIGAKGSFEAVVRREDLANTFKDASLPPVLSTPVMIKFMENAALRAIRPDRDGNATAVGTAVSVRHLAATPVGRKVRAEAEVTAVDGTHISFSVRATDFEHEIGEGLHERRVLDGARLARHIAEMEASDSASRDERRLGPAGKS
jgi:fluoroacetyl-CoA thioesterase